MPKCSECKFFMPHPTKSEEGQCRKDPPKLFMMMMEQKISGVPKPLFFNHVPDVHPDFWCGEFMTKLN